MTGPNTTPGDDRPTTATLLADEIERRARGDVAPGSPDDLTEALNRWVAILRRSIATTPGDDRGRELAREAYIAGWIKSEEWNGGQPRIEAWHVRGCAEQKADAYIRTLAVPDETGAAVRGRAVDLIDDVQHDCPVWVGERAVEALESAGLRVAPAAPQPGVTREAVVEAVHGESGRPAVINAQDSHTGARLLAMLVADRLGLVGDDS